MKYANFAWCLTVLLCGNATAQTSQTVIIQNNDQQQVIQQSTGGRTKQVIQQSITSENTAKQRGIMVFINEVEQREPLLKNSGMGAGGSVQVAPDGTVTRRQHVKYTFKYSGADLPLSPQKQAQLAATLQAAACQHPIEFADDIGQGQQVLFIIEDNQDKTLFELSYAPSGCK
jgi:hypothetical protein